MLWNEYCLVRVCVEYRGRAVPIGWRVLAHNSSSVSFEVYRPLLQRVSRLDASGSRGEILSRPGLCRYPLMRYLKQNWGALPHPGQNDLWVWRGANPVSTQAVSPGLGE